MLRIHADPQLANVGPVDYRARGAWVRVAGARTKEYCVPWYTVLW